MAPTTINVNQAIAEVERLLEAEKNISPALRAAMLVMVLLMKLLTDRLGLNSKNSSKPPSTDIQTIPKTRVPSGKKVGAQLGHKGTTLTLVENPDAIETIALDPASLPKDTYVDAGFERRQVFQILINRHVIEYRAQVLKNSKGKRFVAPFPKEVSSVVQYGASVKSQAVYLSQQQLIPYDRVQSQFAEMYNIPLSVGTLFSINQEAYTRLEVFETLAKQQLCNSALIHADETSINIGGKRFWLHNASNDQWTMICAQQKRGTEAMNAIGILPKFKGVLVHDHWKPYYTYTDAKHSLCNAHHLRELARAHEQDGQTWALTMIKLLNEINGAVVLAGGVLDSNAGTDWLQKYRSLLAEADLECPKPNTETTENRGKERGRIARSKARNLLERLRDFESDTLRFMTHVQVPFTNNQGERDIRMTKVQQKISGCFRSEEGANISCRVRSYLSTCSKHGIDAGEALAKLFAGEFPQFIQNLLGVAE